MKHRRPKSKDTDLIVRELDAGLQNLTQLIAGAVEVDDNVNRFFNDTPYILELVAVRLAILPAFKPAVVNASAFGVVEVSRQAIAGQQEGIIANQRGIIAKPVVGAITTQKGEMLFGDYKTPIMTLEVQESIFLHIVFSNTLVSGATLAIGDMELDTGATLYFRVKALGY